MHSQLETYLSEVAAHLDALPVAYRNEELREMRAHLENAVIVSRELGQTEDEAAQTALTQFGTPETVAREFVAAWRRGTMLDQRSFWGASVSVTAFSFVLCNALETPFFVITPIYVSLHYVVYLLAGFFSGLLFPIRAIAGTTLTAVAWLLFYAGPIILGRHWVSEPAVWVGDYVSFAVLAVLGAWGGSRWRKARMGRERLARG